MKQNKPAEQALPDVPHFTSWRVVKEEFADHWQVLGNHSNPTSARPLMRVWRAHKINGLTHVVDTIEWGKSIHFFTNSEDNMALMLKNRFALSVLHQAQAEVNGALPKPECRPTVNFFEEMPSDPQPPDALAEAVMEFLKIHDQREKDEDEIAAGGATYSYGQLNEAMQQMRNIAQERLP